MREEDAKFLRDEDWSLDAGGCFEMAYLCCLDREWDRAEALGRRAMDLVCEERLVAKAATRPTHVRITGPANVRFVTVGKDYEAVEWHEDGSPIIVDNAGYLLCCAKPDGSDSGFWNPTWEPAEAPDVMKGGAS